MRRTLTLTVLVLLALGLTAQARADFRVMCPVCMHDTHTTALYECPSCEYQWGEEAYSGDGFTPPRNSDCPPGPGCGQVDDIAPYAMICDHPDCSGGTVWP